MTLALIAILLVVGMSVAREDSSGRALLHGSRVGGPIWSTPEPIGEAVSRPDSPSSGRAGRNERGTRVKVGTGPAGRSLPPACPFRESPEHHYVGPYHRSLGNGWMRGCSTGYASWETGSGNETFCGPELQNSGRHTSIAKRFRVGVAPCGSILRVCTLSGAKCIRVTVVDQGPCYDPGAGCWDNLGRDLDLNYRASVWFKGRVSDWDRPVVLRWTVLKKGRNPPWG